MCRVCGAALCIVGAVAIGIFVHEYRYLHVVGLIGIMLFAFGLATILASIQPTADRLIRNGDYVMADITEVLVDHNAGVDGATGYRLQCAWTDPATNIRYTFKSGTFFIAPVPTANKVKVYVNRKHNYRQYLVDIWSILPSSLPSEGK